MEEARRYRRPRRPLSESRHTTAEKADYEKEAHNSGSHNEGSDSGSHNERLDSGSHNERPGGSSYNERPGGSSCADKKEKKKHTMLIIIVLLILAVACYFGYKFVNRQSGYYTVAVFGVDSRNGNVGKEALSDVNIIARVDMATGEIKLVSIYRDTYTQIDEDGTYHKFNEAYFRGGPEQAIWALEHNTDVKVDDYVSFNWKAVVDAINILGGVDVEISDAEFKYINAYITETVNSTGVGSVQLEHAGANHLDGVQAVAYARLRKMDDDYTRTQRQRRIISLMLDKAKNADFAALYNVLVTVLPQTSTSVGISDLLPFAKDIKKYYIGETAGFPFDKQGKDIGKLDAVIPVTWESNDIALHNFLYPDQSYSPSSLVKKISAHVAEVSGLGGSGETAVRTDNKDGGDTNTSNNQETKAEETAQTASETEAESMEKTTIEEISDPGITEADESGTEEADNDSYADEDIVPTESEISENIKETQRTETTAEGREPEKAETTEESKASGNVETAESSTGAAEEKQTEGYAVISGNSGTNGPGPGAS